MIILHTGSFCLATNTRHFCNSPLAQKSWHRRLLMLITAPVVVALLSGNSVASSSIGSTEYNLKAAYLYQFTKFTQWPSQLFSDQDSPIQICILGKDPFGKSLDSFSNRVSQGRKLSIKYLPSLQNITNCHVVFISRSEDQKLPQILHRIEGSPVLSVSDIDNFAHRGGIIGFVPRQRKVGLEINIEASHASGTKISSKLLEVATLVQQDSP